MNTTLPRQDTAHPAGEAGCAVFGRRDAYEGTTRKRDVRTALMASADREPAAYLAVLPR